MNIGSLVYVALVSVIVLLICTHVCVCVLLSLITCYILNVVNKSTATVKLRRQSIFSEQSQLYITRYVSTVYGMFARPGPHEQFVDATNHG